jgi:hypothetical protein
VRARNGRSFVASLLLSLRGLSGGLRALREGAAALAPSAMETWDVRRQAMRCPLYSFCRVRLSKTH